MTVAIPVRDGSRFLREVLSAVRAQEVDREIELLVVDSGSSDGSPDMARKAGARVVEIAASQFSHGGTRNTIMELANGDHVAFLTQDARPLDSHWLARLLAGFGLADDVALVFGPYLPRAGASHMVRRELRDYFRGFAPDGRPAVQRLEQGPGGAAGYRRSPSALTFFTDANGCVARWAWEQVPYREIGYAEDQLLAAEMIEAGFAKVFQPDAAVVHSHEYRPVAKFRRCFDEWRGLREVYGHVEDARPRRIARRVLDEVRADVAFLREQDARPARLALGAARSLLHHAIRMAGAIVGSRADRLPAWSRKLLSLEGRADFRPAPAPLAGPGRQTVGAA